MNSKTYIPALTGVRGLAAFLIFLDHYNQTGFPPLLFRIFNEFHFPRRLLLDGCGSVLRILSRPQSRHARPDRRAAIRVDNSRGCITMQSIVNDLHTF